MAPAHPGGPPDVVVAVATYRRPAELARVLPEVLRQAVALRPGAARVLVVDNDPAGSAATLCARWPAVTYVHEPRPGIAAARNRALGEARALGPVGLLAFVDDDELPLPGWLQALVDGWGRWRCAAVVGPVETRFAAEDVDPWVAGCGEFDRVERADGTLLGGGASNNLLLDLGQLAAEDLGFDDTFGLTGGSDTMLTHALVARGREIRWCAAAVVADFVPADRSTRRWTLRRAYRKGNTWSRVAFALAPTGPRRWRTRLDLVLRGAWRSGSGAARWTAGALRGRPEDQGRGATTIATGLGVLGGALGHVRHEYAREPRGGRYASGA